MPRPRTYGERVTTAIRLPEQLHDELQKAASERDVSINLLVTKAVEDYLERLIPLEQLTTKAP